MHNKNEVIIKLKNDVNIRGYSGATEKRYLYIVDAFLNYMETIDPDKSITDYDEYDVINYLHYLNEERKYKNSSYNNVNSILKFFLETTLEKNIGYRRLPNRKIEVKIKVVPSKKQILSIIDYTKNLKHKCWFSLAYGSGLRVSEISRIKLKDIDFENEKIVVSGKGNVERLTILADNAKIIM